MSCSGTPCSVSQTRLVVRDLGLVAYDDGLRLMSEAELEASRGGPATLFLLEHPAVITLGRSSRPGHVLASRSELEALGVALHEVGRGGDVTYHGPGQLVGYPVMRLPQHRRDAHRYLRDLEEVLIRTLADFGLAARRLPGLTGVWLGDAKIAAIGVRFNRWVTSHGFALNVRPRLEHFDLIVPCGLSGRHVTTMERQMDTAPPMGAVKRSLVHHFLALFGQ